MNVYEIGNYIVYPVVIVYAAVYFAAIKHRMVRTVISMFSILVAAIAAFLAVAVIATL